MAVDACTPPTCTEPSYGPVHDGDVVIVEALHHDAWRQRRCERQVSSTDFVQWRWAALAVVAGPWTMNVDLLRSDAVGARVERVARRLRIADARQSEDAEVEGMGGLPVVDVDDHMIKGVEDHRRSLPPGPLPPTARYESARQKSLPSGSRIQV